MLLSRLRAVSNDAGRVDPAAVADPDILGLTADSRAVARGWLFAALPGVRADGRAFINQAVENGAVAVLATPGTTLPHGVGSHGANGAGSHGGNKVTLIEDENPRAAFARMAAAFYGAQPDVTVAVTGTNGKTSTVTFARQIWAALGETAASLGTLGLIGPGLDHYGAMTTPDPVSLHRDLAQAAAVGVDHLAMEASSHGIAQHRLDGVRLMAGGFTNLTRDHLDYHQTMDAYFVAKAELFARLLPPGAAAVLNADVAEFAALQAVSHRRGLRVIGYGAQGREITLRATTPLAHGQRLDLTVFGRDYQVDLPLAGGFQAANALCALGLVLGAEPQRDAAAAVAALAGLAGVPGRMQHVATFRDAPVFVDYAHTPDALETVLKALRPHATGRLICVFGCGGDRDPGKRPVMGELAGRLADVAIVTDDNPRSEEPAAIRAAVLAGGAGLREIGDRAAAIQTAVGELQPGDVLVIAGKGHEQGQIIGADVRPFDDATVAQQAVRELGA